MLLQMQAAGIADTTVDVDKTATAGTTEIDGKVEVVGRRMGNATIGMIKIADMADTTALCMKGILR